MNGNPHRKIAGIIALDGPASSGKTTLGKKLADHFGYLFFDTGVMYRAVTWAALSRDVPVNDERQVTELAQKVLIDIRPPSQKDGRNSDVWLDGLDVTWEIRRPEVDGNVSVVSAYPGVRKALSLAQRQIGLRGRVVMVGRDIGTVILPEAEVKIYLDASAEERASRRFLESKGRGEPAVYAEILQSLLARDAIDSTREVAPLRPAEDAVILDSDGLDIEQVYVRALQLIEKGIDLGDDV